MCGILATTVISAPRPARTPPVDMCVFPLIPLQLDDYRPKLKTWYMTATADDTGKGGAGAASPADVSDKLQLEQWKSICVDPGPHCEQDLVGIWECYRESAITGDPACKTKYTWRLSMPQIKMAFLDSQPPDSLQAAQSSGTVCGSCCAFISPSIPGDRRLTVPPACLACCSARQHY